MAEGTLPAGSPPGPGGQLLDDRAAGATAPSEAETGAVWRDNLYCVSVPPAGRRRLYRIHSQLFIKLDFDLDLPQSGRRGDDMVLRFDNGSEVVFEGFLRIADRDPTLHLLPPDGSLLPGDTVAAGLDALPGPPPALQTERPGAAGTRVARAPAAAPGEALAPPAVPADRPSDWPAQEILDDLQAKGLPVPAVESGESGTPGETLVSAADLVSQVAEALPDFGALPEAAPEPPADPAPQPSPVAPPQEEAAPQEAQAEATETPEPAPEPVAPLPEPPSAVEAETERPVAEAAKPEAPPVTPADDGTIWADELPGTAPAPEPEPQAEASRPTMPGVEDWSQPDEPFQEAPIEDAPVLEAPALEARIGDVWTPEIEAREAQAETLPAQEIQGQDGPDQEAPGRELSVQEVPEQEAVEPATNPTPEANLQSAPAERAEGGLGDDVRFLPEQSLEDLLPPELLGQEPLPEALHEASVPGAPVGAEQPEGPGTELPGAPAAADPAPPPAPPPVEPAVWAGDLDLQQAPPPAPGPVPQEPLPPEPTLQEPPSLEPAPQAPEPLPPEPLPLEALAAELAPQAAAEAVWEDAQSWPDALQAAPQPEPDEAPWPEAAEAEQVPQDLSPEAPAVPAAPPAPMPPSEAVAAFEPPVDSPVEPPVDATADFAAEPSWPSAPAALPETHAAPQEPSEHPPAAQAEAAALEAPALPETQGGFYPAAAPFAPAEGHWQVEPSAAEVPEPVSPAAPAPFENDPVEPLPAVESPAEAEAWDAPAEDPDVPDLAGTEVAEPELPAGDPAPALPDPDMVVKATQILAAFEQLSAVGAASQAAPEGEPLAEAPELFDPELPAPEPLAEEAQVADPGPEELMPESFAPTVPDDPGPDESAVTDSLQADPAQAGLPQFDASLPAEPAAEAENPTAATDEAAPRAGSEAEGPQDQAGGGLLRSAVANVLRARSLILPGRGAEVGDEAQDEEEETLPADSEADGPQDGVLELTDSYEEPLPDAAAEPQLPTHPAAGETAAPEMNAMDLFADPMGEDLPDLGEELPPKVPSFLTEPARIETARRTGGKVTEIPSEVRDAVMLALHGMEEEDLFDFDGEARPPEADSGEMVAVPIEGAARPVGVIFADKGAPGDQEGEALPGAPESGQLPD